MVTVFERLPDEILLEVCLRLDRFDLVRAFGHLNGRFDALLCDSHLFRSINIDSDKLPSNYTGNTITYGRRGIVKTLRATVRCRWLDLSHFANVNKLILLRPSEEQYQQLRTLIATTEHFRQLKQLTFIKYHDEGYISRAIITGVFPQLRHCHLYKWHIEQNSVPCESLRSLTLDILLNLPKGINILISLPNLIRFRVNDFCVHESNPPIHSDISSKHDQLKHFHISLSGRYVSVPFSYYCGIFYCILPFIPKLKRFSIHLTMKYSRMDTDSSRDVSLLLTKIAEYLPIDCCCDCHFLYHTAHGTKTRLSGSYWQQRRSLFISRINQMQIELAQKHPAFTNLRCHQENKEYVIVSTKID